MLQSSINPPIDQQINHSLTTGKLQQPIKQAFNQPSFLLDYVRFVGI